MRDRTAALYARAEQTSVNGHCARVSMTLKVQGRSRYWLEQRAFLMQDVAVDELHGTESSRLQMFTPIQARFALADDL